MDGARIANAQVRLGTSTVMVSEAIPAFPAMAASYYLYVEDTDNALQRAVTVGAEQIMPVGDMPYGARQIPQPPAILQGTRQIPGERPWPAT